MFHEWGRRGIYIGYVGGKAGDKRPLGIPRGRQLNVIKMDLRKTGEGSIDWNGMAQDGDRGVFL
jgi:hypothetical protein